MMQVFRLQQQLSNNNSRMIIKRCFSSSPLSFKNFEVVILSSVRTPIGSFRSKLSPLSATQLGSIAIKVVFFYIKFV